METSGTTTRQAGQQQSPTPLAPRQRFDGRFAPRILVWWTGKDRELIKPQTFERLIDFFAFYGHYAMLAAVALSLFFYIVTAVKVSDSSFLVRGIVTILMLLVVQYIADRFCFATRSFVEASPCRLSYSSFLDVLAVLSEVVAIVVLIGSLANSEGSQKIAHGCVGLATAFFLFLYARLALHPSLASTTIQEGNTAGEEALGIVSFLIKTASRLAPVAFGLGATAGCLVIIAGLFPLIDSGNHDLGEFGVGLVIAAGVLPFVAYLVLVFNHLAVEIARAILDTPRRISELRHRF